MKSASVSRTRPYQRVDVALGSMRVNARAQRELREYRVQELAAEFDFDMLDEPVLNWVGDTTYHVIDGQHRIEALKRALGEGWETFTIPCRVYKRLTQEEEADMFDRLNNTLTVNAYDKFQARVTAGREIESAVARIVESEDLHISRSHMHGRPGGIACVSTLVRIYKRADGETLKRTLRIVRDAFGEVGFESRILDGISLVCQRYNGTLNDAKAVSALQTMRGGAGGLTGKAVMLHKQTGNSMSQCIAATAIEVINRGRGGKKLPGWWSAGRANEEARA